MGTKHNYVVELHLWVKTKVLMEVRFMIKGQSYEIVKMEQKSMHSLQK